MRPWANFEARLKMIIEHLRQGLRMGHKRIAAFK